eukprot:7379658-Prymnesium_polylepis.2
MEAHIETGSSAKQPATTLQYETGVPEPKDDVHLLHTVEPSSALGSRGISVARWPASDMNTAMMMKRVATRNRDGEKSV